MKIGAISRATGTNVETVRYYERIGLLPRPVRTTANYRDYGPEDVDRLRFIRHARGLGFDISDIRSLLDLSGQPDQDCCGVDEIATRHLTSVERKIRQLGQLREQLEGMLTRCRGGQVADCHILQSLADG